MKTPHHVKGIDLINILRKHGYEIKSRKGSHVSLSNGQILVTIVLPLTSRGVFKKISKATNIPEEEFL
ncbi:MAG TPA: type II toxin-antitoxin system HicA family toxin [Candidatus Nanoarchaeia archaeon]|nr:type II toxin-antitoxin system HicA family toxin [Candidatus Nanoarchaeia archaeon]